MESLKENNIAEAANFIESIVEDDVKNKAFSRPIATRFPPEPNGYLHIGSAYAINISYNVSQKYNGTFNLRFDDTNPAKEDMEYVRAIIEDMKWLGFDPNERIFYGSDYSNIYYEMAIKLIKKGKAYVCDLNPDEIREYRGTLTSAGINSPYRDRSVDENLKLFEEMKVGKYAAGEKVLRAKIDMSSPNINMRDPVIYRIQHVSHYKTGNDWCIYPMYDFAHPLQDAIEGITHSLCSNEFKNHRPLYEWFLNELDFSNPPCQREFGRMNLSGVVTSKRYLKELVFGGYVDGWDDPRLPTIKAFRRRGITPESIKNFLTQMGIGKTDFTIDISMLDHYVRNDLKSKVPSIMAVLDPIKVTITNYPKGEIEYLDITNNPENETLSSRKVPFSRNIFIEKSDFMENPIKGFHRLMPSGEVRLKGAYFIKCNEIVKDENGEIIELLCTYDPETKSGSGFTGRKVKGTIHWVCDYDKVEATVNLYDKLILDEELLRDSSKSWEEKLNPESKITLDKCFIEPFVKNAKPEDKFQFMRHGYFCVDRKETTSDNLVFNRTVSLKDSFKK